MYTQVGFRCAGALGKVIPFVILALWPYQSMMHEKSFQLPEELVARGPHLLERLINLIDIAALTTDCPRVLLPSLSLIENTRSLKHSQSRTPKEQRCEWRCAKFKIGDHEKNLWYSCTDIPSYTLRFQELALMCGRMFPEESDEVEKYVSGLPNMIQGNVMSYRPKTMEEGIEFTNDQMDQKGYQQLPKRQSVAQAYAVETSERKEYARTLPLCNKCKFHHHGPCIVKCANCKKVGHLTRDCWNPTTANHPRTISCYEYGNQGHYKSDYPKLENQNHGNQAECTKARGMAYALGGGETNQDLDNIEDDINA
ncbi:reverse transcriptase domain-containing protein [Tanacetum coccineum]